MDKLKLNLAVIPGPGPTNVTAAPPAQGCVTRDLLERTPVPLLITP
jgi:hypothetical protein